MMQHVDCLTNFISKITKSIKTPKGYWLLKSFTLSGTPVGFLIKWGRSGIYVSFCLRNM